MMQMAKPMPGEREGQTQQPAQVQPSPCPMGHGCGAVLAVGTCTAPLTNTARSPSPRWWSGGLLPLKMGQMRFQMGMAPVLWNCPRASSM